MHDKRQCMEMIAPAIRRMKAYHVQDAKGMVKLDAMECPWGLPETLMSSWLQELAEVHINRYPDPHAPQLKSLLRQRFSLPPESALILGNGSDELLQLLILMVAQQGGCILSPIPCFSMYEQLATILAMEFIGVPLNADDFSLDVVAMLAAIKEHQPRIVFLSCPHNPTGNLFTNADIEKILDAAPGWVVLDEAYSPYAKDFQSLHYLKRKNLIITRTLSKVGLAGLRFGYMLGDPELFAEMDKVRLPYNINVLTQATVTFVLRHFSYFEAYVEKIIAQRAYLKAELEKIPSLRVYPSQTNFLTVRTDSANALFDFLKSQGILLKNISRQHRLLQNCLRITVGSEEENRGLLEQLHHYFHL